MEKLVWNYYQNVATLDFGSYIETTLLEGIEL